eukprot:4761906-Pleurochrysis_carterae.AAC.18
MSPFGLSLVLGQPKPVIPGKRSTKFCDNTKCASAPADSSIRSELHVQPVLGLAAGLSAS